MPGDTIRVSMDGYTINGQKIPRSPRSLCSYFITLSAKETFLETLEKLDIPLRDFRQENFGCMLSLTAFEEYQLREELPDAINRHFIGEQMQEYMLIVPRKDRAYPLDAASLTACASARCAASSPVRVSASCVAFSCASASAAEMASCSDTRVMELPPV